MSTAQAATSTSGVSQTTCMRQLEIFLSTRIFCFLKQIKEDRFNKGEAQNLICVFKGCTRRDGTAKRVTD